MPSIEILADQPAENAEAPAKPSAAERKVQARRFHPLSLLDHARLLLPFLIMGALGAAAKLRYPYWWPAADLVAFAAECLIVTAMLGLLLEVFSAKLLVERVSEILADRLIGRGLPAELQSPIREVVDTEFVRDHFVKSYTFSTPEAGYVKVDIELRYEVKNYSETVRDYAPELAAEIFLEPDFRFLEYGIAGRKIHTFFDETLSSKVETDYGLNIRRVPRSALPTVSLKPFRTGEKSACQVTWRYRLTVPEQYCDVTSFDEATLGATLQVQNVPEEFEFVSGGDASLHHEVGSQSWFFEKSFIPGQHLRAWWFPRVAARPGRHVRR